MQVASPAEHTSAGLIGVLLPAMFVIGVLLLLLLLMKRTRTLKSNWLSAKWNLRGTSGDSGLQLIDRINVAPGCALCMVKAFNRRVVVGVAPSGWTVLLDEQQAPSASSQGAFGLHLARAQRDLSSQSSAATAPLGETQQ